MDVWMIWLQADDHTWLEAAWDNEATAENPTGWDAEVERVRKLAAEGLYDMRIQKVLVPKVYELFESAEVVATNA